MGPQLGKLVLHQLMVNGVNWFLLDIAFGVSEVHEAVLAENLFTQLFQICFHFAINLVKCNSRLAAKVAPVTEGNHTKLTYPKTGNISRITFNEFLIEF